MSRLRSPFSIELDETLITRIFYFASYNKMRLLNLINFAKNCDNDANPQQNSHSLKGHNKVLYLDY